jgi:hypothetical protein
MLHLISRMAATQCPAGAWPPRPLPTHLPASPTHANHVTHPRRWRRSALTLPPSAQSRGGCCASGCQLRY